MRFQRKRHGSVLLRGIIFGYKIQGIIKKQHPNAVCIESIALQKQYVRKTGTLICSRDC